MSAKAKATTSTPCPTPEYGATEPNTIATCTHCGRKMVWDSPYGYGRWVHYSK